MRRLVFITIAVLALALPAVAGALKRGPGDGTLVVDNAQGTVVLRVKGGIIGRFDAGTIDVIDVVGGDGPAPVLRRCEDKEIISPRRQLCSSSTEVRFRLIGGLYRVRIDAIGIDLSVVGRGSVALDGSGFADQSGRYSVNGASYQAFPHARTNFLLATPAVATLGSK
jgi:hypothetical protein